MNAGWFPDPSGQPGQRYFDGQQWTQQCAPPPPPMAPAARPVAVAVSSGGGPNHALHAVLTFLMSCGMWLPIWILVAIFNGSSRSAVAVGGGAGGVSVRTGSNLRTPLIAAVVFFGLVILGAAAQHPWLLVVLVPMIGAGGCFFWKQKTAQDRKDQDLREQYRRDVVADRADYEDKLNAQGDPRGTYGRYPPPE